jgi:hypothetical protein
MSEFVTLRDSLLEDRKQQPRDVAVSVANMAGKCNERGTTGSRGMIATQRRLQARIAARPYVGAGLW